MQVAISQENKIVLEELKSEVLEIKQEATELSISLLIQLKTLIYQFLLSYNEYSLTNIRRYGLAEILMSRANRFFKLDQDEEEPKKPKEKKERKLGFNMRSKVMNYKKSSKSKSALKTKIKTDSKSRSKVMIKKMFKIVFFPFYLLILIVGMLLSSEANEKSNKNAKNTYKAY